MYLLYYKKKLSKFIALITNIQSISYEYRGDEMSNIKLCITR